MAVIGELLFFRRDQVDLDAFLRHQADAVLPELVERLSETDLDTLSAAELTQRLLKQAQVDPLTVDFDRAKPDVKEITMRVTDGFGDSAAVKGLRATKTIPYSGVSDLWSLRTNPYDLNPPRGEVTRSSLLVGMELPESEASRAATYIDDIITRVKVYLKRQEAQTAAFNIRLPGLIAPLLERRRSLRRKADDLLKRLQGSS